MNNIMIDIETLGNEVDAAILSIGACEFDIETGDIGDTFYTKVGLDDAVERQKRKINASTLRWWLQQDEESRKEAFDGAEHLFSALHKLDTWMTGKREDYKVWGNGSTFDISILEHALRQESLPVRWKFWNVRDVRTVVDLAYGKVDRNDFEFDGVPHHALDDAKHQAKYVSAMYRLLKGI